MKMSPATNYTTQTTILAMSSHQTTSTPSGQTIYFNKFDINNMTYQKRLQHTRIIKPYKASTMDKQEMSIRYTININMRRYIS